MARDKWRHHTETASLRSLFHSSSEKITDSTGALLLIWAYLFTAVLFITASLA
jgi:hypothetical protein